MPAIVRAALRHRAWTFAVSFLGISIAGISILHLPAATRALWVTKTSTARLVAGVLSALGDSAAAEQSTVHLATTNLEIIDECTGAYAFVLLGAFILAYPCAAGRKLRALLLAVVFVEAVNLARLVTLGWLLVHAPSAAGFAHDYLWQVVWAALLAGFAMVFAGGGSAGENAPVTSDQAPAT